MYHNHTNYKSYKTSTTDSKKFRMHTLIVTYNYKSYNTNTVDGK